MILCYRKTFWVPKLFRESARVVKLEIHEYRLISGYRAQKHHSPWPVRDGEIPNNLWGVARGSSVSWVAKGDKNPE